MSKLTRQPKDAPSHLKKFNRVDKGTGGVAWIHRCSPLLPYAKAEVIDAENVKLSCPDCGYENVQPHYLS